MKTLLPLLIAVAITQTSTVEAIGLLLPAVQKVREAAAKTASSEVDPLELAVAGTSTAEPGFVVIDLQLPSLSNDLIFQSIQIEFADLFSTKALDKATPKLYGTANLDADLTNVRFLSSDPTGLGNQFEDLVFLGSIPAADESSDPPPAEELSLNFTEITWEASLDPIGSALQRGGMLRLLVVPGEPDTDFAWRGSADPAGGFDVNVRLDVVPEPSAMALLLAGTAGLFVLLRRRR